MIDMYWLETCVTAGEFLYGIYPASILKKMYESKKGCTISMEGLKEAVQASDSILMEYVEGPLLDTNKYGDDFLYPVQVEGGMKKALEKAAKDGNPYADIHLNEDVHIDLMDEQGDVDFYIPTAREIVQLVEEGYISTPAMTALEDKIKKNGGEPAFLKGIWSQVSTDKLDMMEAIQAVMNGMYSKAVGLEDGEDVPEEMIPSIPTLDDLNAMMPLINNFLNNVNLRARRGWRPEELAKKMPRHQGMPTIMPGSVNAAKMFKNAEPQLRAMGANVDYSSIDNFTTVGSYGERRVIKVGRNDPCPCGSGLKYKRCHGK